MTRLTREVRETAVDKASRDAFKEPVEALRQRAIDLARRIYGANFVSGKEQALLKECMETPDVRGYIRTCSHLSVTSLRTKRGMHVNWSGMSVLLGMSSGILPLDEAMPVISEWSPLRDTEDDFWDTYVNDLTSLLEDANRLYTEFARFRDDVAQLLASCATVNKLLALWPEAAAYLPKYEPPAHPVVPVSLVARINAIMRGNRNA